MISLLVVELFSKSRFKAVVVADSSPARIVLSGRVRFFRTLSTVYGSVLSCGGDSL